VDRGVRVVSAPYRDSTPRPDAAPRVRRRWALRGDDLDRSISGFLWAASAEALPGEGHALHCARVLGLAA